MCYVYVMHHLNTANSDVRVRRSCVKQKSNSKLISGGWGGGGVGGG